MSYADNYDPNDGIAIVGMAGRFPGARDVPTLWRHLVEGHELISRFDAEALEPSFPEDEAARQDPAYVRARGVLDGIDEFDDAFFGFSPAEAALLDPQQRLFLQAAWEALEHAGHDPARFEGPIGVFAGATANSYYLTNLQSRRDVTDRLGLLTTQMGNQEHYLATRVAYKLDLHGPALNVHTACSTSGVAVCMAVQSLQTFQCDMALAGGVSVTLPQRRGYLHQEGSILSPDGHCRAFDAQAAGTVFGNGLGVVVLRRLSDALADGDTIYAVIKGTGLNNDGHGKLSFTAPSVDGQAQAIELAQAMAGIDPDTIGYVEAHGTGTALGDPIEIAALTQAFRAGGAQGRQTCAIGSLKTNIGHLDAAAGVAGLIKAALVLHHGQIPASLHFTAPNPKLELEHSPFYVNDRLRAWPAGDVPRRAAVSSFGVGGTNVHLVLEEAPRGAAHGQAGADAAAAAGPQLLLVSGHDEPALQRNTAQLGTWLAAAGEAGSLDMAAVAGTLLTGRHAFAWRRAVVADGVADAAAALAAPGAGIQRTEQPRVGFLFPGQGAQRADMGRGLYERFAVFRDAVDGGARQFRAATGVDLLPLLYPEPAQAAEAAQRLRETAVTQPALFIVEYALAQLWMSWGVKPTVLLGHSVGEFTAAAIAGTFEARDALELLIERGRLMQALPPGAMLSVRAPAERLQPLLGDEVSVAAYNAPGATVVSGSPPAIAALEAVLDSEGLVHRRLETSHAFHSPMMEPIVAAFVGAVAARPRQAPRLPWISSLTGQVITPEQAVSPVYWGRQLREPVAFLQGLQAVAGPSLAWLEVGPGTSLSQLARQLEPGRTDRVIEPSLPPAREPVDECRAMLQAAGRLWCHGVDLDAQGLAGGWLPRRMALPTYAFARHRRWVEPGPRLQAPRAPQAQPAMAAAASAAAAPDAPAANDAAVSPAPVPAPVPAPLPAPSPGPVPASASLTAPAPDLTAAVPSAAAAASASTFDRPPMKPEPHAALVSRLQTLFAEFSGLEPDAIAPSANFLELGLDSLLLTQASHAVQKSMGVSVPMRSLLEDLNSIERLAAHLAPQVPVQDVAPAGPAAAATPVTPVAPAVPSVPAVVPARLTPVAASPSGLAVASSALPVPGPASSAVAETMTAATAAAPASMMPAAVAPMLRDSTLPGSLAADGNAAGWSQVIHQQLALMERQLAVMQGLARGLPLATAPALSAPLPAPSPVTLAAISSDGAAAASSSAALAPPMAAPSSAAAVPAAPSAFVAAPAPASGAFGPYRPPVKNVGAHLTPAQQARLHDFIARYNQRTAGSKAATQAHRRHLADPRSVAGFRSLWKELVYPLVTVRSQGSALWDVDGHRYVDITNGFGMILFGHNPDFIHDAVARQLQAGYEIGPQTPLAGEVAAALCEMVGMERAAFCGTGSEAVTAALRVARTVTGRDKVVIFNGAYHGIFDEVLVRPLRAAAGQVPRSAPIAPGIPASMADNIIVLDYGSDEALRTIEQLGPQLAAVMVEPVQSRRPELQPREFLQALRRISTACGAALIFDEVVTGFRTHPGGAQAVFGVRADIATYGKVIGGGLPIGVVAGSARFLDALDGGAWQFGDDSAPEVGVTFFAGTFVRHPLALAAARAVLQRLKDEGPALQQRLDLRTAAFVARLQRLASELGAPLTVPHFSSWFCLQLPAEHALAPLFFAAMRLRGVHVWEGRPCFLTLAHTDEDLDHVAQAVHDSLAELQAGGFLPGGRRVDELPPVPGARRGRDREGREAWFVPDPDRPGKYLQVRMQGDRDA